MTRLTPVELETAKDSVKDTLDELAARGGALGPMVLTGETDIDLARQGTATDPKVAAIVGFAQQVAADPHRRRRCLSAA